MKSQNKLETKKSAHHHRLAMNLIGVTVILGFVLGCSFSKFEFGKKTKTGSKTTSSDTSRDENLPLKEKIVGKWNGKIEGRQATMTFTADGRTTMEAGGRSQPARYKVLDEETIATADGGDENYNERVKVKIVGDTLTVSQPSGKQIGTFTRAGGRNDPSESSSDEEFSGDESGDSSDTDETTKDRRFRESFGTIAAQLYRANKIGDTAEMERLLADDFTIVIDGETVNKRDFIKGSGGEKNWVSSQAKDTRLITKEENRVIAEYKMILEYTDKTIAETCQAEFVNNNNWQIRKSLPCSNREVTKK